MKKELLYLTAIILGSILIIGAFFGFDNYTGDTTIDFNVRDTYYVFPTIYGVIFAVILMITSASFVRVVFTRFKIKFTNYIFLFFNALLILCIVFVCKSLGDFEAILRENITDTTSQQMASSMHKGIANLIHSGYFMLVLAIFIEMLVLFKTKKLPQATSTD
ncbi:hypothetical protein [Kordia sp.]|uniref:hypothetical protein n=1 Tax=Kordia sp. TaxID=1965332 RepID=UPI003B595EC6